MLLGEGPEGCPGRAYGRACVTPVIGVPCSTVGASESGAFESGGGVSAAEPTTSSGKRTPGNVGLSESLSLWSRSSMGDCLDSESR